MVPCGKRFRVKRAEQPAHGHRRQTGGPRRGPTAAKRGPPAAPADSGADARFRSLTLDFLAYLELERGLSRNTLNAYRTDLFQYGEYLSAHHLDALKARPAEVGEFLAERAAGAP